MCPPSSGDRSSRPPPDRRCLSRAHAPLPTPTPLASSRRALDFLQFGARPAELPAHLARLADGEFHTSGDLITRLCTGHLGAVHWHSRISDVDGDVGGMRVVLAVR